jgi:hypothetical protein
MALGTICPHFAGPDKSPLSSSFDRYLAYIADQSSIGSALSAVDVQSAIKGKWCPNVSAPKISGFQVLRQRNAALRSGLAAPVVSAWDGDLVRYLTEHCTIHGTVTLGGLRGNHRPRLARNDTDTTCLRACGGVAGGGQGRDIPQGHDHGPTWRKSEPLRLCRGR